MAGIARREVLALQNLSSSNVPIVESSSNETLLVHNILLHNTHTADVTILLNHQVFNGDSFKLWQVTLQANETLIIDFVGEGDIYSNGDGIYGSASVSSENSYVICKICGTIES